MPPAEKKQSKAQAAAAAKLAERQAAAENAFAAADADGSGEVDASELQGLLMGLLQREGIAFDRQDVAQFVEAEFAKADTDGSGGVDFDEFIQYYNSLIDRITGGAMNEALEAAKKATLKKLEEEAIAEDDGMFHHLYTLLSMLSSPSVKNYAGLVVPFQLKQLRESGAGDSTPNPEHGSCSRGFILDLSRRGQRLLTPWGSLPLGYRLSYPGYQEKNPPPEEEEADKKGAAARAKAKKAAVPWPIIPAHPDAAEERSMFFELCRPPIKPLPGQEPATPPKPPMLRLRKLKMRCHFQVIEMQGTPITPGEVQALTGHDNFKKLQERWQAQIKKNMKDPRVDLPAEDTEGGPLVNLLVNRCVAVRADRLDSLKKRKEVTSRAANKRFPEEDLERALLITNNNDGEAAKTLVKMQGLENTVLDRRAGHATRASVRYALQTCAFDGDQAEWMLKNQEKLLKQKVDYIWERRGLETGLGYPSRQHLERLMVQKKDEGEGAVMAELKRQWKVDIEMMTEIIAAAEVEEMLTPERGETFCFSKPMKADEMKHAEDLYLSDEFKRDKDKVIQFLSEAGTVLKRAITLGEPTREEVEGLLRDMAKEEDKTPGDPPRTLSDRVVAFLTSLDAMCQIAPKQGAPTREDCRRYLTVCERDEAQGTEFMKTIWKLANPKPPKPPPKGSKKPPQPHYSLECGFPSREECEWALLGTRAENKEGKPLAIDKAVEQLQKLDTIHTEVKEGKYPGVKREDVVWSIDPARTTRLVKVRPIMHEEYKAGESPASLMLEAISQLTTMGQETGIRTPRLEMLNSLEKLKFDLESAKKYLNGVGNLMSRQIELGIVSRDEVEAAMEYHSLDDTKVITLFEEAMELTKRKLDIGSPTRDEIKSMLTLAWSLDSERLEVAAKCLAIYRSLMADDTTCMSLFGKTPNADDAKYIQQVALRFRGDATESMGYLRKVSEILAKGESLGNPSRELVIETLDRHGLEQRKATQEIREEYHRRRDLELKEEYARNKAKAAKAAEASTGGG